MNDLQPLRGCVCEREIGVHASEISVHGDRNTHQKGAKRLTREYGDRLVCVRYRYDEQAGKRYTTVELIVDEAAWKPQHKRCTAETIVGLRVEWRETKLQQAIKAAGGRWNKVRRVWELCYGEVVLLKLEERIEDDLTEVSNSRNRKVSSNR